MNDYATYQFYNPAPPAPETPTPGWRSRKLWLLLVFALSSILILALLVVLILNILKNRKGEQELDGVASMAQTLAVTCDQGDTVCRERALSEAAQAKGVAAACLGLTSLEAQTNCVTLIAKETNNLAACEALNKEASQNCRDQMNIFLASSEVSFAKCEVIVSPELKASCSGQVWAAAVSGGNCLALGINSEICDSRLLLQAAENSGNPAACDALLDQDDRYDCNFSIENVDSDSDGLTTKEEFEHGTDSEKADTDNDGYSDGTEVKGGYDPLS